MGAILRGRHAAILAEHERHRLVAYEQARWIAFAFNDPKHMPEFRRLRTASEEAAASQAAVDDARVRGWFIARSRRKA